jgi:hypothetical protein
MRTVILIASLMVAAPAYAQAPWQAAGQPGSGAPWAPQNPGAPGVPGVPGAPLPSGADWRYRQMEAERRGAYKRDHGGREAAARNRTGSREETRAAEVRPQGQGVAKAPAKGAANAGGGVAVAAAAPVRGGNRHTSSPTPVRAQVGAKAKPSATSPSGK